MAAQLTRGKTFAATEQVTNSKLHQLIDSGTIANIDQTNIVASSGLVVQSASQPSDTDALWNDTGNNLLKYLRSGAYKQLIDEISDQTVAGIKTFSGNNVHSGDNTISGANSITGINTFNEEIISGADADSPPVANALYKDNIIKGWIQLNGTGTIAVQDSFNVSGITDLGVGNYSVTWDTDFANDDYAVVAMSKVREGVSNAGYVVLGAVPTTSVVELIIVDKDGTSAWDSPVVCVIAIGDQ